MKRFLSLILVSVMLLACISCQGKDTPETTTPSETVVTTESAKPFVINASFKIIRSEFITDQTIVEAMQYIRKAIEEAYGHRLSLTDDWYRESAGLVPNDYEILIGRTNRPQSKAAYDSLKNDDYMYSVDSENVITICGGNNEATLEAVKKFCLDVLGYDGKSVKKENPELTAGVSYKFEAKYDYETVTINSKKIEDFTIAVRDSKYTVYTVPLVEALGKYNGHNIKVKELSELNKDVDKNVIYVGASGADGSHLKNLGETGYLLSSKQEGDSLSVILDTNGVKIYGAAIGRFITAIKTEKSEKSLNIILPENDIIGFSFENSLPQWSLKTEKEMTVADGVTYIYQEYTDENNKPYKAYVLKIDPSKAYLYMGSSNDGYDFSLEGKTKQTVLGHMNSAKANGIIPVAGVNADFFAISGDYHPTGLTIKEGKVISDISSRPWCGYTLDGEFVCKSGAEYRLYKDKLRTAVGASDLIVHEGLPYELDIGTEFSDTAHPRTLAGVAEDGTIILAVVDGRQKSVSNGAPLPRCAVLMISHGAVEAVNLDGGGSSCMIVQQSGAYKTVNSPSDGSLRKVYNSLLVVPKK